MIAFSFVLLFAMMTNGQETANPLAESGVAGDRPAQGHGCSVPRGGFLKQAGINSAMRNTLLFATASKRAFTRIRLSWRHSSESGRKGVLRATDQPARDAMRSLTSPGERNPRIAAKTSGAMELRKQESGTDAQSSKSMRYWKSGDSTGAASSKLKLRNVLA